MFVTGPPLPEEREFSLREKSDVSLLPSWFRREVTSALEISAGVDVWMILSTIWGGACTTLVTVCGGVTGTEEVVVLEGGGVGLSGVTTV